jgi:uncharacterized protein YciI
VHLDAHRAFLDLNYQRGYFIVSGPRSERHLGGVIVARVESEDALLALIAEP